MILKKIKKEFFGRIKPKFKSMAAGNYVDFKAKDLGSEIIERKRGNIKLIFFHIHKCGGTSFIETIEKSSNAICCASINGDYPGRTGRDLIPDEIWDGSIRFTCVRNPYARVVSAYTMFNRNPKWRDLFPSFDVFVSFLANVKLEEHSVPNAIVIDDYKEQIDNIIHHCTTYNNPKYFLDDMNVIIKLEDLQKGIELLKNEHGLDIDTLSRRKHSGGGDVYQSFYCKQSRDLVSKIYAMDIDRFEYVF